MSKFNQLFTLAQKSVKAGKSTLTYKEEGEGTLTLKMTGVPDTYDAAGMIALAGAVGAKLTGKRDMTADVKGGLTGTLETAAAHNYATAMLS